MVEGKGFEPL